ncbi:MULTISPECIES: acyltransferase [Janthinobacterium]|uniref:acyltransferase family protein n=1 Tax=Janthinobacterium TaxID=29580 RepID=UPI001C5B1D6B|nr:MULTISPECIES: acyltransferase [Janthinobacterium]MBW3508813.1 acyltransferase [Janthinobacterium sp. NKUCC06_STL]MCA1861733.1 acyltransferase [Janthinobacterium lividum]
MQKRNLEIDGIRGWAAASVLFFHLINEMFGALFPQFRNPLTHIFFNGGLAVAIFFVLSGDALSISYYRTNSYRSLDSILIKRYFRLTVPILMSCALVYALMRSGLTFNIQAAAILHREAWLGAAINFNPSLIGMLRYSLISVYDAHTVAISYNPYLWTMSVEMIGSFIVIHYLYMSKRLSYPTQTLITAIVFLYLIRSFNALFLIGVLFAQLRSNGFFDKQMVGTKFRLWRGVLVAAMIAILVVADDMNMLVAPVLVYCFYTSKSAIAFFSNKISVFLGDISFPLYLVHFAIISSLTSYLVIEAHNRSALNIANAWLIIAASVAASITAAIVFRWIEARALILIDRIPKILLLPSDKSCLDTPKETANAHV